MYPFNFYVQESKLLTANYDQFANQIDKSDMSQAKKAT